MSDNHTIRYNARTHVGYVRQINEDSLLSLPDHGIWVVSDGMGGHDAGDYASQMIVETVAAIDPDLPPGDMIRALREALNQAHDVIIAEAARRGSDTIGATVVALALTEGHFACIWSGDSRLYRFQNGGIELLSHDHSLVAAFVEAGQMTWDQAEKHPQSNVITQAIGIGDAPELEKIRGEVLKGDRFLLCSDGLNKYAGFQELADVLAREPLETVVDALMEIALDGGGADNISIIVVDVE